MLVERAVGPPSCSGCVRRTCQQWDGRNPLLPSGYEALLIELKERVRAAQIRAALSVNREMVLLYWEIGAEILNRQEREGWGTKVIDRLSADLRASFPQMTGLSSRNLKYMRSFAAAYPHPAIVQRVVAQIPWGHNVDLLDKLNEREQRLWYAQQAIANGWSRPVLSHQIESGLYQRQGSAITNFDTTLPAPQSDLARQILKDPYTFDFLQISDERQERELEQGLIDQIQRFLLELGMGFAFVGRQYHLEVEGEDFYLDLLFYHLHLRCYIVIELKVEKFKPEFAGKMNFYLAVVDDLLRHPDDQPAIGLILCKEKNRVIAEYSLRNTAKPIGVAEYVLTTELPKALASALPSTETLRDELLTLASPSDV